MERYYAVHPIPACDLVNYFIQIACSLFIWVLVPHAQDPDLSEGSTISIYINNTLVQATIGPIKTFNDDWRVHFLFSEYTELPKFVAIPYLHVTETSFLNVSNLISYRHYQL